MKRKLPDVVVVKEEILPKRKPETAAIENNLNLKTVCSITHTCELNSPFCLSSSDDFLLLRSKNDIDIMNFGKSFGSHDAKFQLESAKFPVSTFTPGEHLKVQHQRIFNNASHQQKNDIMLSSTLFPNCVVKNFQTKKVELAPMSLDLLPLVASLSTHGSLGLSSYYYDTESNEAQLNKVAELSDIRKRSFDLSSSYVKLEKLQEILKELSFRNFNWCPQVIIQTRYIAAVTKSNELAVYSINALNHVEVEYQEQLGVEVSDIKWFTLNNVHFIFVGTSMGNLTRLSVQFHDGKIAIVTKPDELKGKLQIPITSIQVAAVGESVSFICTKSHSLEVFVHSSKGSKTFTQFVGNNITGIVRCGVKSAEYLITTLNNKVYFMALSGCGTKIECLQKVDNTSYSDIQNSNYAAYGITTSKNKVLTFIALYPQRAYDHLVLKQPLCVTVNLFSKNDPSQVLINNKTMMLTDFVDCVETVRYVGICKVETLEALASMEYKIELTKKFLYYLKLQLIVLQAKTFYYEPKSDPSYQTFKTSANLVKDLIDVVNVTFLLKSLTANKNLSDDGRRSMQCLSIVLKSYLASEITIEPFKKAQQVFRTELEALIAKCKESKRLQADICHYCREKIDEIKLNCRLSHNVVRCAITKLQLPIGSNVFCTNCSCSVMEREILKDITGVENPLCPFCDRPFKFLMKTLDVLRD